MKTRNGFVSNSSSSSFVCNICGREESGMNACPSDFDMMVCVNGHCFCEEHTDSLSDIDPKIVRNNIKSLIEDQKWIEKEEKKEIYRELEDTPDDGLNDFLNNNDLGGGEVIECQCPLCSMMAISKKDGFLYLMKKFSLTETDVLGYIRNNFKTYSEFSDYINK